MLGARAGSMATGAVAGTAVRGGVRVEPARAMNAGGVLGRTGGMAVREEVVGRAPAGFEANGLRCTPCDDKGLLAAAGGLGLNTFSWAWTLGSLGGRGP